METIEYRPAAHAGWFNGAVFVVTAAVLGWLGLILSAADRAAMDGWTLLLFTAVPIRWFAWICALIFLFLGIRVVLRVRRVEPTLALSRDGLRLPDGTAVGWDEIESTAVSEKGLLVVDGDAGTLASLSSFELGADPAAVAAELGRFRAAASGAEEPPLDA